MPAAFLLLEFFNLLEQLEYGSLCDPHVFTVIRSFDSSHSLQGTVGGLTRVRNKVVPLHSECLPTPSLTVSKDSPVITLTSILTLKLTSITFDTKFEIPNPLYMSDCKLS